ncbi:MAG TPA: alpha/beta-hydrolase family protein [Tetrasphaera sp.]|nr:alpha/beta-hydrolase family protein [Tetrasphaera sp.]
MDNGRHIRFATTAADLRRDRYGRDLGPWSAPRVVYLQHASDPIVWWQPSLAVQEPDWIGERAGSDVDPSLRWWPLVTSWMIRLDLAVANNAAPGHGHIDEDDLIDAWAPVLDVTLSAQDRADVVTAIRNRQR